MNDLAINLLASVIAGIAVWLYQRVSRYRRSANTRAFLGLATGPRCLVSLPRHLSSTRRESVHRRDLAATVDVAALVEQAGGDTEVVVNDTDTHGIGTTTEFCIGGPLANPRASAHLTRFAPGFHVEPWSDDPTVTVTIGDNRFPLVENVEEFAFIFKIVLAANPRAPLWVICGQTALSNQAAARYLRHNLQTLRKTYGTGKPFCVGLRVVDSRTYGFEHVEEVGDLSDAAFGSRTGG